MAAAPPVCLKQQQALERLHMTAGQPHLPDQKAAFGISGISGTTGGGLKRLFMTHTSLEERIEALRRMG